MPRSACSPSALGVWGVCVWLDSADSSQGRLARARHATRCREAAYTTSHTSDIEQPSVSMRCMCASPSASGVLHGARASAISVCCTAVVCRLSTRLPTSRDMTVDPRPYSSFMVHKRIEHKPKSRTAVTSLSPRRLSFHVSKYKNRKKLAVCDVRGGSSVETRDICARPKPCLKRDLRHMLVAAPVPMGGASFQPAIGTVTPHDRARGPQRDSATSLPLGRSWHLAPR
jgi:hypothetical protein